MIATDQEFSEELSEVTRLLTGADWWDSPGFEAALKVLGDESRNIHNWLKANTRMGGRWQTYPVGKSDSVWAGPAAALSFYAKEDAHRGGDFWKIDVFAALDGKVVVRSSAPGDRMFTDTNSLKWSDLKNPKKLFSMSRKSSSVEARSKLVEDISGLSSGTIGTLTGLKDYKDIDKVRDEFAAFADGKSGKWQNVWKEFAKEKGFKQSSIASDHEAAEELVKVARLLVSREKKELASRGKEELARLLVSRGKAQAAILEYLDENPGGVTITDLTRMSAFRGIHFGQIEQSVNVMKRKGLVNFDGKVLSKVASEKVANEPVEMNTPEFKRWLKGAQAIVDRSMTEFPRQEKYLVPSRGNRYIRVVVDYYPNGKASGDDPKTSVWAFIDRTNGDVLKPAGWSKPAKHARGNIWDSKGGLGSVSGYGPAYL